VNGCIAASRESIDSLKEVVIELVSELDDRLICVVVVVVVVVVVPIIR
jgi:hypothetical protein